VAGDGTGGDAMKVSDIVTELRRVQSKMSQKNDHRAILHQCELALMALVKEQPEHVGETPRASSAA
jgi:hypothetical protein